MFGPKQLGESNKASPDKYFKFEPVLQGCDVYSDQSDWVECTVNEFNVKIRKIVTIFWKKKIKWIMLNVIKRHCHSHK